MKILQLLCSRCCCPANIPQLDCRRELLYEWQFTANQFVLAPSPLRFTTSIFFQLNTFGYGPYVACSYFTVPNSRLPQPGRSGPCIYISQEQGGPVIPPGTGDTEDERYTLIGMNQSVRLHIPLYLFIYGLFNNASFLDDNSSARITQKTQPLFFVEIFTAPLRRNGRGADHIEKTVLLLRALPSKGCIRHNILLFISY
jgi:hypothetical protein